MVVGFVTVGTSMLALVVASTALNVVVCALTDVLEFSRGYAKRVSHAVCTTVANARYSAIKHANKRRPVVEHCFVYKTMPSDLSALIEAEPEVDLAERANKLRLVDDGGDNGPARGLKVDTLEIRRFLGCEPSDIIELHFIDQDGLERCEILPFCGRKRWVPLTYSPPPSYFTSGIVAADLFVEGICAAREFNRVLLSVARRWIQSNNSNAELLAPFVLRDFLLENDEIYTALVLTYAPAPDPRGPLRVSLGLDLTFSDMASFRYHTGLLLPPCESESESENETSDEKDLDDDASETGPEAGGPGPAGAGAGAEAESGAGTDADCGSEADDEFEQGAPESEAGAGTDVEVETKGED